MGMKQGREVPYLNRKGIRMPKSQVENRNTTINRGTPAMQTELVQEVFKKKGLGRVK